MASYGFTVYRDAVRWGEPTEDAASRSARVRTLHGGEAREGGYVLYWMQMYQRGVPVDAIDANGLVPLSVIPDRQYAAYTIRPRLHARIPEFLVPEPSPELQDRSTPDLPVDEDAFVDLTDAADDGIAALVAACDIDHAVPPSPCNATSGLSPYLHFGCLSTGEIVRRVLRAETPDESVDDFLEELVVRRELAYNFCRYTPVGEHTTLDALPDWARKTLAEHADDERDPIYDSDRLERAETHDGSAA